MSYDPSSIPGWNGDFSGLDEGSGYSAQQAAAVASAPPPTEPARAGLRKLDFSSGRARALNPGWQFFDAVPGDQNTGFGTPAGYYRPLDGATDGNGESLTGDLFANGQWWMRDDPDAGDFLGAEPGRFSAFSNPTFEELSANGLWDFNNPEAIARIVGLDQNMKQYQPEQYQRALDYYGRASTDPELLAHMMLNAGGVDAYGRNIDDVPGMLAGFDPEMQRLVADNMMGILTAQQQSLQDKDWTDYADSAITMAINSAVMGGLGAGFGGLGASLAGGGAGTAAGTGTGAKVGGMLGKAGVNLLTGGGINDVLQSLALSGGGELVDSFAETDPADYDWRQDPTSGTFGTRLEADPFLSGMVMQYGVPQNLLPDDPLSALDMQDAEAMQQSAPEPNIVETVQKYAKVAKTINEMLGGQAQGPQDPGPDASPEEQNAYAQQLVDYLSLDVNAMAEAGLEVGTPEYMDYILQQADSIIAQILGDMDVDSEDLAAQLRTKTADEMRQLQRALYVRGALGTTAGSGEYTDPFSGLTEDVIGEGINPGVAAYQRGVARNVTDLAGRSGGDALDFLNSMLSRDTDLYGMQQSADQRYEQALRQQAEEEDRKRRRGMFGAEFSL